MLKLSVKKINYYDYGKAGSTELGILDLTAIKKEKKSENIEKITINFKKLLTFLCNLIKY